MVATDIETIEEKKSLSPFRHFTAAGWGCLVYTSDAADGLP